jgi:hypothetical protein
VKYLRPSRSELKRLAERETDVRFHHEFEPIVRGPLIAVALLIVAGVLAVIVTPFRLLAALTRNGKHA